MSVFLSVVIILIAMLIQAFLQLNPGLFACFYHHALGKTSRRKADDIALSYILGTEIYTATIFLVIYFVISFSTVNKIASNNIFVAVITGIFIAESVITSLFYFRKKSKKSESTTTLFLPRRLTKNLITHAESVKSRSDTIALGIVAASLEFFFTLPLYIIISIEILNLDPHYNFIYIIAYIIITTIPLFSIRTAFHAGHNLAEIQRFRVKNKFLTRLILSSGYLLIAILVIMKGWL